MTAPEVSLVIVSYEIERELPRTLRSLARPYQQNMAPATCEIIVVDNGSAKPPQLEDFRAIDADLHVLHQPNPGMSPVAAINTGLAVARAPLIGVWIDGARLASPGLLAACMAAAKLHPRPVITTLNYQIGPGLHYESGRHGYDRAAEERLLAGIAWPADGYRLFDIATPENRGGEAGPLLESNALFLPRALWAELGGYDPAFTEAGGGVVNADTLLRACALPETQLIRIAGEGTFHQFHGGLSTSSPRSAMETLKRGAQAYQRRRGVPLRTTRTPGWLFDPRRGVGRPA